MIARIARMAMLVALAFAVACGSDDGKPATRATTAPGGAGTQAAVGTASTPTELKDLVVGLSADGTVLSGPRAGLAFDAGNYGIYERLVKMDNNFQIQPWLAEKWEFIEPNTWRFSLRKDVRFHDGTPLTAKDVVFTLERIAAQGGRTINAVAGGTKAVDDYTVDFTPGRPNRKVPLEMGHPYLAIMKDGSDPVTKPVGTGPYKFVEYKNKEYLKVERWAEYWDKANAGKAKSITFKYIPDNNARVLALKAGDVDLIVSVPRESVAQIKSDSKLAVALSPVGAYQAITFMINGEGEWALTSDRRLREAIAKAIDRETIVKQVWEGNAEVGRTFVPPAILGAQKDTIQGGPKYDLAGAQKILDDLGWKPGSDGIRVKDGKRLELVLVNGFPDADINKPLPEVIQQMLKRAGIDVKIVETTSYDDTLKEGKGHLWLERGNQNSANPAFFANILYKSVPGGNNSDYGKWFGIGPKVDDPINQAQATADLAKTQELVAQAMRALIDEEFVVVNIAGLYNIWAHNKNVEGLQPHSANIYTDFRTVFKK